MFDSVPIWMMIVGFLLVLGPLVTVHELGHYLVGRWFGVQAEAFSIGFGREIWGRNDRHGTRWKLSILPLGGYVQFKGDMNPASVPNTRDPEASSSEEGDVQDVSAEDQAGCFQNAALWKRALIVFAGPLTNILVALVIFFAFNMIYGEAQPIDAKSSNIAARFADDSAAEQAGMELGDQIVAIDGEAIGDFKDILNNVLMHPDKQVDIVVQRGDERLTLPTRIGVSEEKDQFGNVAKVGRIGVYSPEQKYAPVSLTRAASLAVEQSRSTFNMMMTGIGQILSGKRSVKELGGPIKIAKYSGEQLSLGLFAFVSFSALISLNLAFINLLPIPALDGGHLAFYAVEAVRRKPVGAQATEWAYRMGMGLVLVLMVFVTVNDVLSLPIFGG